MDKFEAKELLADSVRCLATSMEQIRLRETEKEIGENEPMQDFMAQCTKANRPYVNSSVEDCCKYLIDLYKGFEKASEHEIIAEEKHLYVEGNIVELCDMIWGGINHNYEDQLVNCARKVETIAMDMLTPYKGTEKTEVACSAMLWSFDEEVVPVLKKYGYYDKSDALPILYLNSWMRKKYWEEK